MYKYFLFSAIIFSTTLNAQVAEWAQTGPVAFPTNISGQIHGIGRTTQIKFDPIDANTIWATTASGGLYVSYDNGLNWNVTGTDSLPPLNCASVCVDYTDNNIIYLGTGDPNYYYESYGIYKSTDGGNTWNPANATIGNRMALELLMKPTDNNTLIAATDDGIYKTTDGAVTWTEKKANGEFTDMIFKPDNDGVIYAVDYAGNYFRSADWGDTWTDLSSQIIIPGGYAYGARLGVSEANPNVVYIATIAGQCTVFRSDDAGLTFTQVKTDYPNLNGYSPLEGGQGNYNFDVNVDPDDANKVYVVGHVVWKSVDGGINWTQYTDWWADCHTDMHQIVNNPNNHAMILNANDGGIFVSYDEGDNWDPYADGLGATEIYHAAQSELDNGIVSIGTQDNGELYYGDSIWYCNRGGDWGARMWFDFLTYNKVYYYYGYRRIVTGGDESWNKPFADPDAASVRMAFTPASPLTGYVSQYEVWRSDDISSSSPEWQAITSMNNQVKALAVSPADANNVWVATVNGKIMHTTNALDDSPTWNISDAPVITDYRVGFAVSKNNPEVAYLYTYNYVFRTDNAAASWTNITYDLPAVNIVGMYLDDYSDSETVYIANAFNVYYRDLSMDYWQNYSQGLPTVANIQELMLYNDGSPNSILRVGYYGKGVWESKIIQPHPIPAADFYADKFVVCPGTTIQFTDASTDNTETWSWTFEGGTPATSTDENPVVNYNTPGIYQVTLTASNTNGSDTIAKTSYITVSAIKDIPLVEGFQTVFPPTDWTKRDANSDGVFWTQTSDAGGYNLSTQSTRFDNYFNDVAGARDALVTPQYDFTYVDSATVSFDVAYARYSADYPDTLAVLISADCGATWNEIWVKSGTELATAPDYTDNIFIPSATEWRTETINLSDYLGSSLVTVAFENRGHYGQGIYLDNINIQGKTFVAIQNTSIENTVSVFPNPVENNATIFISSKENINGKLILTNNLGEIILSKNIQSTGGETKYFTVDMSKLPAGIYFIEILNNDIITATQKIIKQ